MRTLYVQGDSLLHRLSPRLKLLLLAGASVALFVVSSLPLLGIMAVCSAGLYAMLGLSLRDSWQRLRPILLTIVIVALFTLLVDTPVQAATVLLRLTSLMLLAAAITATTGIGAFIDEITWLALPLERLGLMKASDIGLSVGLVIRFVPEVLLRYISIRDAHYARGLKPRPLTLAVPMIILTLRSADEIAAAIDARGLRGQK
ncbi:energy-coupling factor transporter transmembrane protein EcfT [Rhizobium deserti]|uniref:Energy-coupling factor transporter transmembrane protein EcfT n=1 Tax=Rhizobium deserti TaxID=2547961 RepID=A0A4R5UKK6_9HYPH|nr:energy-coupling factor transporter transmembrane protein EcfT [Rhizobium deserti]TDK37451.1 energy-coupling factor transporter transmembrane protein EcfT [Rhizobium deserti]